MDSKDESTHTASRTKDDYGPYGSVPAGETAGAAAARAVAEKEAADSSLRISRAVTESLAVPARRAEFAGEGMTGAQVFANLCQDENLAALFCAPGNYHMVGEIAQVGIPCYGGRTEGGMCSAADAFSRVTGEVTACSGTEGPGLTHMIMNIAAANAANTPLLVLASNTRLASEDNQKFIQFMYQQPLTEGIRKYGKRITVANRIYEYGSYAFRHLKSGVPGVVHLDFPQEVALARFKDPSELECNFGREKYRSDSRPSPARKEMERAVDMIHQAERPVLIAGHGVFLRKGWEALERAAEKQEMAVVGSGPVRGNFPDEHRLSGSMSNAALMNADLVVFVGQYQMPSVGEYTLPNGVKTIRVHPVQEEIGRNWPVDLGIVSDERHFLEALADGLKPKKRDAWVQELAAAKRNWDEEQVERYGQFLKYTPRHRYSPSVCALQGGSRFSVQGQDRSAADADRVGRQHDRVLRHAVAAGVSSGAGDPGGLSVRADGSRPGHGDGRRRRGPERHRPAGPLPGRAGGGGHRRRGHGLQHVRIGHLRKIQAPGDLRGLQQQLLGFVYAEPRTSSSIAPARVSGKSAVRQDGGTPRRARRVRAHTGRVAGGLAAQLRCRGEGKDFHADQLPGPQGIQRPHPLSAAPVVRAGTWRGSHDALIGDAGDLRLQRPRRVDWRDGMPHRRERSPTPGTRGRPGKSKNFLLGQDARGLFCGCEDAIHHVVAGRDADFGPRSGSIHPGVENDSKSDSQIRLLSHPHGSDVLGDGHAAQESMGGENRGKGVGRG